MEQLDELGSALVQAYHGASSYAKEACDAMAQAVSRAAGYAKDKAVKGAAYAKDKAIEGGAYVKDQAVAAKQQVEKHLSLRQADYRLPQQTEGATRRRAQRKTPQDERKSERHGARRRAVELTKFCRPLRVQQ